MKKLNKHRFETRGQDFMTTRKPHWKYVKNERNKNNIEENKKKKCLLLAMAQSWPSGNQVAVKKLSLS